MRYMGWSYDQLMACPAAYLDVICELAQKEADEARRARRDR